MPVPQRSRGDAMRRGCSRSRRKNGASAPAVPAGAVVNWLSMHRHTGRPVVEHRVGIEAPDVCQNDRVRHRRPGACPPKSATVRQSIAGRCEESSLSPVRFDHLADGRRRGRREPMHYLRSQPAGEIDLDRIDGIGEVGGGSACRRRQGIRPYRRAMSRRRCLSHRVGDWNAVTIATCASLRGVAVVEIL